MSLGSNIRRIRTEKKISLESFALKLGLPADTCDAIEDDRRPLSSVEIQNICQILGVTFDSLVCEKKSEQKFNTSPEQSVTEESVLMPVEELRKLLVEMKE